MADPESDSLIKPHFFQPLLPGFHTHLNVPVSFFKKHIEGRLVIKTATLNSDVSQRTWEVKMDGRRFTEGWKEFAVDHDFRVGDFAVFRHEGDLVFNVTGFGTSSCNLQYSPMSPSPPDDDNKSDEHNNGNVSRKKNKKIKNKKKNVVKKRNKKAKSSTDYTCLDAKKVNKKRKKKAKSSTDYTCLDVKKVNRKRKRKTKSSTDYTCLDVKKVNKKRKKETKSSADYLCLDVTASNLNTDRRGVPQDFARLNHLKNKWCEIALMNEQGSSWKLDLRHREDGQVYIRRGWTSFCDENGLKAGDLCTFKLVRKGTKPALQLCRTESSNNSSGQEGRSEANRKNVRSPCGRDKSSSRGCSQRRKGKKNLLTRRASTSSGQNRFVMLQLTPFRHETGQLPLPVDFTRLNGIEEPGKITLLDKYGVEWPSYLRLVKGSSWSYFYIRKKCKAFCKANGVEVGQMFVMELIWEDTTPILKFCSKKQQELICGNNVQHKESSEHEENQQKAVAQVKPLTRRTRETVQAPIAAEETPTEAETQTHKRLRVQAPIAREESPAETETLTHKRLRVRGPIPGPARGNRSKHQENQCTDATRSKATPDSVAKAKQRIEDALTALRQSREELTTKEQNLEASLREFDALGEET